MTETNAGSQPSITVTPPKPEVMPTPGHPATPGTVTIETPSPAAPGK